MCECRYSVVPTTSQTLSSVQFKSSYTHKVVVAINGSVRSIKAA